MTVVQAGGDDLGLDHSDSNRCDKEWKKARRKGQEELQMDLMWGLDEDTSQWNTKTWLQGPGRMELSFD